MILLKPVLDRIVIFDDVIPGLGFLGRWAYLVYRMRSFAFQGKTLNPPKGVPA
jgi:hypothetical protein